MKLNKVIPLDDCEVIDLHSEAEWLKWKRENQTIGSSTAAIVMGLSPYEDQTPEALYAEMTGRLERDESIGAKEAVIWGTLLEEPIAQRYKMKRAEDGAPIHLLDFGRYTIMRSKSRPWQTATLDRIFHDPSDPFGWETLECKAVGHFMGALWAGEPPLHHQVQVQQQLDVLNWQRGNLAACVGGQRLVSRVVERNEDFISVMRETLEEFLDYVKRGVPLPLSWHGRRPPSADLLKRLYPKETPGVIVELGERYRTIDRLIAIENYRIKLAKERIEALKCEIKEAIGFGERASLGNGNGYNWKTVDVKGYTVAPQTRRQLTRTGPKFAPEDLARELAGIEEYERRAELRGETDEEE